VVNTFVLSLLAVLFLHDIVLVAWGCAVHAQSHSHVQASSVWHLQDTDLRNILNP